MDIKEKDASIKVTEPLRDAVNNVGGELGGKTQKEVVEYFLTLHRQRMDQDTGQAIPHLDDLRYHFTRIEGVYTEFVHLARDRETRDTTSITQLIEDLKDSKLKIFELQNELDLAGQTKESEISKVKEEVEGIRGEAALARENATKETSQMRELLQQAQKGEQQSQQLVILAQEAANAAKIKAEEFEEKAKQSDILLKERDDLAQKIKVMESEFERSRDHAGIEKDRAIIETEKKYMVELNDIREQLSKSREENAAFSIKLSKLEQGQKTRGTKSE